MSIPLPPVSIGRFSDAAVARPQISDAFVWVAVWVCGLTGLILGLFALLTDLPDLAGPALTTSLIGVVGLAQKLTSRPHPLTLLLTASLGMALMVPMVDTAGHVVILPALTVLGAVGALTLPRTVSVWFAVWCGLLGVLSLFWVLPGLMILEFMLIAGLLTGVNFGSWRFVSIAADLLVREEQKSRGALETNRIHLEFEQAITLCSRALLMGGGEEALETALERLREAIDSDLAYFAVNVDDPEQGLSFRVVKSAIRAGYSEDEWVGTMHPWSKYHMVADRLEQGRPFRHVATETPGKGWNRSILSVPVFIEGRWIASVGFIDIARRTFWSDDAVRMLEVAAPMLGAFWEREITRKRLEELIKSKDQFVASVSHELRTPLAAVLGFAEELRADASSFHAEELTGMLELIAVQSQEMADMVEDLLVSARAEIGTISIRPQTTYLRAQVETVIAGLGGSAGKTVEVTGGRGRVWADPSRTRQIIRNLVTNAIRYGGDHVTIDAVEAGERTVLEVSDDGLGLDPGSWETIFEPYQRTHDAPTQPSSIGLGLTVSRQLARLMGGDLVYRVDARGSVLSLTLPASPDAQDAREAEEEFNAVTAGLWGRGSERLVQPVPTTDDS